MTDEAKAAVYVSWVTFKNAVEGLAQGVPNQIDRSTFPGYAGGVQSQLFAAFKFLGLMTEDDKPTQDLHELAVPEEGKRKAKLKQIIEARYASLIALDLMKATPQEVGNKLASDYSVSGDTKEKALRFFVSAAQYVGIQLSRFFNVQSARGSGNGGKPRKRGAPRIKGATQPPEQQNDEPPTSGTSREVKLKSGGTLSLAASVDLFQLSPEDRTFVFGLIDALNKYEESNAKKEDDLV